MATDEQFKEAFSSNPASALEQEIITYTKDSPLNLMPPAKEFRIFEEPIIKFANGDDPIFSEYKSIIAPTHLTPREVLAGATGKTAAEFQNISVISWILPISKNARQSNAKETRIPTRLWAYTRFYGEKFNEALRLHVVEILNIMGFLAAAPVLQPFFKVDGNEKGPYSNWSERHAAFAAGQGSFGLSDGFISERGIAHRCGSVVTNLALPASPRTAKGPYSNCLFFVDGSCKACIVRCPAGAITESGHDKNKCRKYFRGELKYLLDEYGVSGETGCGLCQVKVPCEERNPVKKKSG
jgi:epoxyqueuosine reductase